MSEKLPEPLVAADVDLSRLDGFMLDTARLLGSELVALSTGEEFKAAVLLWCRAWKQRPACSLPDDDRILASFAGAVPLPKWKKMRPMALRGFVKCSDGRLYHRVLSEDAARAHKAHRQRQEAIRKRWLKDGGGEDPEPTGEGTGSDTGPIRPYGGRTNGEDTKSIPTVARDGTGRDGTKKKPSVGKTKLDAARPPGDGPRYAFEGQVIKLNQRDFGAWSTAYSAIPDLVAELTTIDDKLRDNPPSHWFQTVSGWLRAKHERLLREGKGRSDGSGREPDEGGMLGVIDRQEREWRRRVQGWCDTGFWVDGWGFPPDDPACAAPPLVLDEFSEQIAARKARAVA